MERLARFELDSLADRQASVMRGVAAAVLVLACLWCLLLPYWLPRLVALVGLLFAGLWVGRARQLRRRASQAEAHYLELWPDRLVLAEGGPPRELPWSAVKGIELDEDALLVRLHTSDTESLVIEPNYRGITLGDLHDAIGEAWQEQRAGVAGVRPRPG